MTLSILCKGQLTDCGGEGEKKLWSRRAREFFSTIPSACCMITTDNEIILLEATNGAVFLMLTKFNSGYLGTKKLHKYLLYCVAGWISPRRWVGTRVRFVEKEDLFKTGFELHVIGSWCLQSGVQHNAVQNELFTDQVGCVSDFPSRHCSNCTQGRYQQQNALWST